jgi:hypothetical protein
MTTHEPTTDAPPPIGATYLPRTGLPNPLARIQAHEMEQGYCELHANHSPFTLAFEQSERELGEARGYPALVYDASTTTCACGAVATLNIHGKDIEDDVCQACFVRYYQNNYEDSRSWEANVIGAAQPTHTEPTEINDLRAQLDTAHQHIGALVAQANNINAWLHSNVDAVPFEPDWYAEFHATLTAARAFLRRV